MSEELREFKRLRGQLSTAVPPVGALIRNTDTGDFVNIVLEVSGPYEDAKLCVYYSIRSVRYAKVCNTICTYLNGTRSRNIKWYSGRSAPLGEGTGWHIVEEHKLVPYTVTRHHREKFPNKEFRNGILKKLEGIDTAWRQPNGAQST